MRLVPQLVDVCVHCLSQCQVLLAPDYVDIVAAVFAGPPAPDCVLGSARSDWSIANILQDQQNGVSSRTWPDTDCFNPGDQALRLNF